MPAVPLLPRLAGALASPSSTTDTTGSDASPSSTGPSTDALAIVLPAILVTTALVVALVAWWLHRSDGACARWVVGGASGELASSFSEGVRRWEGGPGRGA